MLRETYIKQIIKNRGFSIKGFAEFIGMPYTTLLSILKNGVGGASIDNIIRICKGLEITIEQLQSVLDNPDLADPFYLTPHEKSLILHYRDMPELQPAVDKLMGL